MLLRESCASVTSISVLMTCCTRKDQIRHGDLIFHAVVDAVDILVAVAGQMQDRLAHGLGGDGSGVDAGAAYHLALFDDRDAPAAFRGLDRRPLSRRTRAEDDHVKGLHTIVGMLPV